MARPSVSNRDKKCEDASSSRPTGQFARPANEVEYPLRFLNRYQWFPLGCMVTVLVTVALIAIADSSVESTDWNDALIGTPAIRNFKANRDIEAVDPMASKELEEERLEALPRIFDFDTRSLHDSLEVVARIRGKVAMDVPDLAGTETAKNPKIAVASVIGLLREEGYEVGRSSGVTTNSVVLKSILDAVRSVLNGYVGLPIVDGLGGFTAFDRTNGIRLQIVGDNRAKPLPIYRVEDIVRRKELLAKEESTIRNFSPEFTEVERIFVRDILFALVRPNVTINRHATALDRDLALISMEKVWIRIKRGEMVVRDGERITGRQLAVLRQLYASGSKDTKPLHFFATVLLLSLAFILLGRLLKSRGWSRVITARDMVFGGLALILTTLGIKGWLFLGQFIGEAGTGWKAILFEYAAPVGAAALLVRIVLRYEIALIFSMLVGLTCALMNPTSPTFFLYCLIGGATGPVVTSRIRARGDILRAGLFIGLAQMVTLCAMELLVGEFEFVRLLALAGVALASGTLAGFIALGLTPVVEFVFRYTTELKLLELANLNHPALKELLVEAPGSYHHSILVGTLAESAADAIGANSLLARVMAYYHDLGKGCNAPYFIENQRNGVNPHDRIKPSMSVMIIKRHVTDGLEVAKKFKLGEPIQAAICEHHGTTLIQYFYQKALESGDGSGSSEQDFRYPGRKPQTREAALVMLADSVEAASRTIADPTSARLQGMINKLIRGKFSDGQLDECDLTLRDLHIIAKAFREVLVSLYHKRIEYPDPVRMTQLQRRKHGSTNSELEEEAAVVDENAEEDSECYLRRLGL
ncbi:MAG: HDIG domain-containing metalloprotein [Myxococcota bacterium]|nr:HDIG domain-containing metalloprotein [Myxococcota bacterium]